MPELARRIFDGVRARHTAFYDDSGSIGRRYRRQDEAGTPFGITVDGPVWFASRRIRQIAMLPPGCAEEREALLQHFGL